MAQVLGIETSCDETAAAVVRLDGAQATVLSNIVQSQTADHKAYGGVVPEIAARAHVDRVDHIVSEALVQSGCSLGEMDAIAATCGPGLIGGVMVGMMTGKALALATGTPFLPINHLEGHALSPRLAADCPFPYLLLLVSGGHCQFLDVRDLGDYRRLGTTIDDAAGEAFDKTAKALGLGFPGGPALERAACAGDAGAIALPRPLLDREGLDMSFAGLKTAAARTAAAAPLTARRTADIAAAFQAAVADILRIKAARALESGRFKRFVVAGGVAANETIRAALAETANAHGADLIAPPLRYCTDNAAMIALAGAERFLRGDRGDLTVVARARWPLDEAAAARAPAYGGGQRGAKA